MKEELQQLIEQCRKSGLRRTKAMEELLATLLEEDRPMNIAELSSSKRLLDLCDLATVYRLLQRLSEHGILRRLGLHERAAYFTLIRKEKHNDYLICKACGKIEAIDAPCPVHELEKEIRAKTGYTSLYHELEFYGSCPDCS